MNRDSSGKTEPNLRLSLRKRFSLRFGRGNDDNTNDKGKKDKEKGESRIFDVDSMELESLQEEFKSLASVGLTYDEDPDLEGHFDEHKEEDEFRLATEAVQELSPSAHHTPRARRPRAHLRSRVIDNPDPARASALSTGSQADPFASKRTSTSSLVEGILDEGPYKSSRGSMPPLGDLTYSSNSAELS